MAHSVEDFIKLWEYQEKVRRRVNRRRRLRKAGLIALVPIAGPLVGERWAENEQNGWQ